MMIESTTASDFTMAHDDAPPQLRSSTSSDESEWREIVEIEDFVSAQCVVVKSGTTRNQADTSEACDPPTYAKVIAEFKGHLDEIRDEWAYITLSDEESGERFFGKKPANLLQAQGIELGTYFRCQIVEVLGERTVSIEPLAPNDTTFEDFKNAFLNIDQFDG